MNASSSWLFDKSLYFLLACLLVFRLALAAGTDPDNPESLGKPPKCFICSGHHDKGWPCSGFVLNPIR